MCSSPCKQDASPLNVLAFQVTPKTLVLSLKMHSSRALLPIMCMHCTRAAFGYTLKYTAVTRAIFINANMSG